VTPSAKSVRRNCAV